ncbi:MAG TPA: serine/threonine-protein kinase [Gemmataceae bacterium]|nr:serine/threonine-protein kinase [Gemmataceae bacterium]
MAQSFSLEPSDDSPTIISKIQPKPVPTENVLAGVLKGRTLAHFQLIEPLGVGGMAAVMRAVDLQLERSVALKILPPEMAVDPENVRRFHQEARSAAKLDHENIARVFFCGEDQSLHFIAFEYVEGENLRSILETKGQIPVGDAVHYVLQIARGLAHAAERGVVHRDIKPSNIIITPDGKAKLVDMGLARSLETKADAGLTQSGVTLGTFDYISPEQALDPREADGRSDIYSLGCTFYHILTGQPPVPEGTAAKKLHHHQHIEPLDPRRINPEIPDDIAAIVARMIAKEAKDRYQEPGHLVQHLALASQNLASSPSVFREGFFSHSPLPLGPRRRPLALFLGAFAAVTALVFLVDQFPWAGNHPAIFDPSNTNPKADGSAVVLSKDTGADRGSTKEDPGDKNNESVASRPEKYDVANPTGEGLRDFLQKNQGAKKLVVELADNIKIPVDDKSVYGEATPAIGLLAKAENIEIRAKHPTQRPTITFTYSGWVKPSTPTWAAAFTLDCKTATIEGLRFRVEACGAEIAMTPLLLKSTSEANINDCSFFQSGASLSEMGRVSSLVLGSKDSSGTRSILKLNDCYFGSVTGNQVVGIGGEPIKRGFESHNREDSSFPIGHEAVSIGNSTSLVATNCAFGPHSKLIRQEQNSSTMSLVNCTAMMTDAGFGVDLDSGSICERLTIQQCLFSNIRRQAFSTNASSTNKAILVRQGNNAPAPNRIDLQDNCFHNLDAFWAREGGYVTTLDDLKNALGGVVLSNSSRVLYVSPWSDSNPLALLYDTMEDWLLRRAFQMRTDLTDLRQTDRPADRLVGANRCTWGLTYPEGLAKINSEGPPLASKKRSLIVDPTANNSVGGIYGTLNAALEDAKPGDTILLRATGRVSITPCRLDKAATDLTIKPFDRTYKPLIALSAETLDSEISFFSIQDGKLQLEGLSFLITPRANKFIGFKNLFPPSRESQTLVRLTGDGTCVFKECLITLDESKNASLAVARIADTAGLMRPAKGTGAGGEPSPHIRFEDCFVRGDGDLIASKSGRSFDLEAKNSLVAISGSFMALEANRDNAEAANGSIIPVRLNSVTAYLKGYLVKLKGEKDGKGLLPINFESVEDCLFISASNKTLVHLEGMDFGEDKIRSQILWDGKKNLYSNFSQLLDLQSSGDEMMTMNNMAVPYTWDKWIKVYGENDQKLEKVRFQNPPSQENLEQARPMNFQLADKSQQSFGAAVGRLPSPTSE